MFEPWKGIICPEPYISRKNYTVRVTLGEVKKKKVLRAEWEDSVATKDIHFEFIRTCFSFSPRSIQFENFQNYDTSETS